MQLEAQIPTCGPSTAILDDVRKKSNLKKEPYKIDFLNDLSEKFGQDKDLLGEDEETANFRSPLLSQKAFDAFFNDTPLQCSPLDCKASETTYAPHNTMSYNYMFADTECE